MRSAQDVAGMACPLCKTGLALSNRGDIEIDYCPTCRGVWLDRGELDKIIERSAASQPPPAAQPMPQHPPQYAPQEPRRDTRHRDYDDDRHHYKYRKKSFLSELFD